MKCNHCEKTIYTGTENYRKCDGQLYHVNCVVEISKSFLSQWEYSN